MARKRRTKAAQWQDLTESEALLHFRGALSQLPDPRRKQGLRYPLESVVVTALMAMVCGADDAEAMQRWGDMNESWLESFLEIPHGSPTQDVFLSVFGALDPKTFGDVFRSWVQLVQLRLDGGGGHVAIDGKTLRRSHDRGAERPALHMLSAWMVEAGCVVAQQATAQKSNEITAIPELLQLFDLSGCTVTIDAMGCQTAIAQEIRDHDAHYLLSVKDNQAMLRRDVVGSFEDACDERVRPQDQPPALAVEIWSDTDKAHGRLEERQVFLCRDLSWVETSARWPDLSFLAMAQSKRTILSTGEVTQGTRYFIGSDPEVSVEQLAAQIRDHWSIENSLHWVLDMGFREDEARHRAGNCAENLAVLRHFALNLLKNESHEKLGVANKRKLAGWNRGYLLQVLTGAGARTR